MTHLAADVTAAQPSEELRNLPQSAALLAYAGSLPLIVLACLICTPVPTEFAVLSLKVMIAYATLLLAYFGGIRWGVAVSTRSGPTFLQLLGSVLPVLIALPLMFFDRPVWQLAFLATIFPVLLMDDLRTTRRGSGAPEWYLGMRAPLTVLMEIALLIALTRLIVSPIS